MRSPSSEVIKAEIQSLARNFRGKKILDAGCGYGFFTKLFCVNGNQVTGLDLQNLVDGQKIPFKFVQGDALRMPFANSSFDVIVSFDVVEHVRDDHSFLKECHRVLRKDGYLIIGTPNKHRLSFYLLSLLGKKPTFPNNLGKDPFLGDIVHLREYTLEEICGLLKSVKFLIDRKSLVWFGIAMKNLEIGCETHQPFLSKFSHWILIEAQK